MKKMKFILPIAALALLITAGTTLAAQGSGRLMGKFKANFDPAQKEALDQAVVNNDYNAWAKLMQEQKTNSISQETFNQLVADQQKREAVQQAIANNDYNAWVKIMSDSPLAKYITQDNFAKYASAEKLMQEGMAKFKEANKIQEELGIPLMRHDRGDKQMKLGIGPDWENK